jgi:hypothetical protein
MKSISLVLSFILMTIVSIGQNTKALKLEETKKSLPQKKAAKTTSAASNRNRSAGDDYFVETFSNGFLGDGANGTWLNYGTVSGVADTNAVWEYRGVSTTPGIGTGSRGQWASPGGVAGGAPVASPTRANGFVIFDSDYLDTKGTNAGNGDAPTPHKSWLVSPTFSTLGSSGLTLRLSTYFRRFQGECFVLLSIDGGVTWGDSVTIFDVDWVVNDASDLDELLYSEVPFIENEANVKIALFFDGETASNTNGSGYYFAMIDDILISNMPDNDLKIGKVSYQTVREPSLNRYYSKVPKFIATHDTIQFSGTVSAKGKVTQENVRLINHISTPIGNDTLYSNMVDLVKGASDSLVITQTVVLDTVVGNYKWAFSVASDSLEDVPFDNVLDTVLVEVTDTTYARDFEAEGNNWFGSGSTYEIGVVFDVYDSVKVTSVSVAVGPSSFAGEVISVFVYALDSNLTSPLTKREFLVLDSATVGDFVSYKVPPVILTSGSYVVTYKTYSDAVYFRRSNFESMPGVAMVKPSTSTTGWEWTSLVAAVRLNVTDDLFICDLKAIASQTGNNDFEVKVTGGTPPFKYLWNTGDTTETLIGGPCYGPYFVTVTDANLCVSTSGVDGECSILKSEIGNHISLHPNPTTGQFYIKGDALTNGQYQATITNLVGQEVLTTSTRVSSGMSQTINMKGVKPGVYILKLIQNGNTVETVKFIME